jgi:hypothetical protein
MAAAWVCARCRRRVPGYIEVCHCGATRAEASSSAAPLGARPRVGPRHVPWQVWLAVGVMGVALLGGAISLLFVPRRPQPTVPLLGYVDRLPPSAPRAKPSAARSSAPKPAPSPSARAPR